MEDTCTGIVMTHLKNLDACSSLKMILLVWTLYLIIMMEDTNAEQLTRLKEWLMSLTNQFHLK